jgi:hypothetical protein
MKYQKFLATKPPAFAAIEKRVDEINRPKDVLQKFAAALSSELDDSAARFQKNPTMDNARSWLRSSIESRHFNDRNFLGSAHLETMHRQSAIRRESTSFATYVSVLSKVAELLNEDIADARTRITTALAEIGAETDPNTVRPLPSLHARAVQIRSLIERCAVPAQRTDNLVDEISSVIGGSGEVRPPVVERLLPQQGFVPGGVAHAL